MLTIPWIVRGSVIFVVAVVIIYAIVWILRNITRHESDVKIWWIHLLQQPRMQSLLIRFAPQLLFIKARLSPQGFLGLHLTVGTVTLIVAGLLFGIIAENVASGDTFTIVDAQIAQWLHAHSTPVMTQCLLILTHLHDPVTISFMVALLVSFLIWKKRWYEVLTVLLVVPGGMLLNLLVKQAFQRARPSFDQPLVMLTTYSFPSGHVAATTLFYGMLAALLISQTYTCGRAALILLLAFSMVIMVAFSRMYLGAHYLSDVLAAFLEGIAWLALCLTIIHTYRVYRETKKRQRKRH